MELSKEIKALTEENWFPIMMKELGYVKKEKAIEWIRKYTNDRTVEFGDAWVFINCMINDWEKENEESSNRD